MQSIFGIDSLVLSVESTKQKEIIALDIQEAQQQRPESPAVIPPGMRVNTRHIKYNFRRIYVPCKQCRAKHKS